MSFILGYLFVTSLFATGIGIRHLNQSAKWYLLTGKESRWTTLDTVGLFFGSLFWPYMVWGAFCSVIIDTLSFVNNLIWKLYERIHG